jgi:hypothetical protein
LTLESDPADEYEDCGLGDADLMDVDESVFGVATAMAMATRAEEEWDMEVEFDVFSDDVLMAIDESAFALPRIGVEGGNCDNMLGLCVQEASRSVVDVARAQSTTPTATPCVEAFAWSAQADRDEEQGATVMMDIGQVSRGKKRGGI